MTRGRTLVGRAGPWLPLLLAAGGIGFLWRVFVDGRGLLSAMAAAALILGAVLVDLTRPRHDRR